MISYQSDLPFSIITSSRMTYMIAQNYDITEDYIITISCPSKTGTILASPLRSPTPDNCDGPCTTHTASQVTGCGTLCHQHNHVGVILSDDANTQLRYNCGPQKVKMIG
jgi:hypothetical protein